MKIANIFESTDIEKLVFSTYNGCSDSKGRLSAKLIGRGALSHEIKKIINQIVGSQSEEDLIPIVSRLNIMLENKAELDYKFDVIITNVKRTDVNVKVNRLIQFLNSKRISVKKKRIKEIGDSIFSNNNKTFNISVKIFAKSKFDRHRILNAIQSKYIIKNLSYPKSID